jgi:hypothetical protein
LKFYSAYGLTIESALLLPDLTSGKGGVDLRISLTSPARPATDEVPGIQCLSSSPARVHLSWRAVGELVVQDGNRIEITPAPNAAEEALRLFVLGAAFGVLLHQRGLLVLHGSAVVVGGRVAGFLGAKGWGKSTTAMALRQRGHPVISDELLVIRFDGEDRPLVMSGSSPIKLRSDALSSMGGDPDSSVPVRPGHNKYFVSESTIRDGEFPLQSLFLLHAGDRLSVAEVPPTEAFFGVVPHIYVCRFGTGFLQSTGADRAFRQLGLLLKRTSVMRLYRQRDLNQLSEIAKLVEFHSPQ